MQVCLLWQEVALFHSMHEEGSNNVTARLIVAEPLPRVQKMSLPITGLAPADGEGLLLKQPEPPKGAGLRATTGSASEVVGSASDLDERGGDDDHTIKVAASAVLLSGTFFNFDKRPSQQATSRSMEEQRNLVSRLAAAHAPPRSSRSGGVGEPKRQRTSNNDPPLARMQRNTRVDAFGEHRLSPHEESKLAVSAFTEGQSLRTAEATIRVSFRDTKRGGKLTRRVPIWMGTEEGHKAVSRRLAGSPCFASFDVKGPRVVDHVLRSEPVEGEPVDGPSACMRGAAAGKVMMGRLLDAYNATLDTGGDRLPISPDAANAVRSSLLEARRTAVLASQPPPAMQLRLSSRRSSDDLRSSMQRAMDMASARDERPAEAKQQWSLAANDDAKLDARYDEEPSRYDAGRESLRRCHQTPNHAPTAFHWDRCGPGLESAQAVVMSTRLAAQPVQLAPCGTVQRPVQGALVFPLQKVASLLSTTFGSNDSQEELEFHDCRTPLALHGSLYAPNRGVYVRLQSAIFGGCVICDHDNDIGAKGSQEWQNYNTQHRGMTARESRAAAQMRGGLNAWWAQNPGRR
jgi:hypothetical protein